MRGRSAALTLFIALWSALGIRLLRVWEQLPAAVAVHFGGSGRANGWQSKPSFVVWIALEMGIALLLLGAGIWLRWLPVWLINVPNPRYWLMEERRVAAVERLGVLMSWLAVITSVFLVGINEIVLRANLTGIFPGQATWALVGFFLTALLAWILLYYRRFRLP